jgi:hypothetical protein
MSDFVVGIPIGIAIGIGIGISIGISMGKNQKPWSELTQEEKRMKKTIIAFGIILLIIGIITLFWRGDFF